jgi:large subunit ribosomal protein L7/L12
MAELTNKDLIEHISKMSVIDLAQLVKELEEKFGVSAAAPMAFAAMPGAAAGGAGAAASEEDKTYDVLLASYGDKKINVIKVVREVIDGLGLKEAKDLVDAVDTAPSKIKEGVSKQEAEQIKKKFEEAGAQVTVK